MNVKATIDVRRDGRYSVTLKLIGWKPSMLRELVASLWLAPDSRRIGRVLSERLEATDRRSP